MKTLTLHEAKEKGYTHYGRDLHDFQRLGSIDNLNAVDFSEGEPQLFLADQKECYTPSISAEEISEIIIDHLYNTIGDNTSDDDMDFVDDEIKKIDFSPIAQAINNGLSYKKYYKLTDIRLVLSNEQNPEPSVATKPLS